MLQSCRRFVRDNTGAVAPLVGIALIGLVAIGALAWDVSRGFALRGELDSAVDAAALAGASQLDLGSDAITRSKSAAEGALITNSQRLANSPEASVSVVDADIKFLSSLSPTRTYTTDPTQANFIEINLAPRRMDPVLGALVSATKFNVVSHAVAGFGAAICLVPPLLVCNPNETASVKTFDPDANIGKLMLLTPSGQVKGNNWAPGNFGFLDVGTVPDLKAAMGANSPITQCFGSTVTSEPGNVTSADQWFNTRFDIYHAGASGLATNSDYSPAKVTIIGTAANAGTCDVTPTAPTDDCATTTGGPYGFPLDCGQGTNNMGGGSWNYARYFNVNHPSVNPASIDWTKYGPTGVVSGQPTRYQVYKWELALLSGAATDDPNFTAAGSPGYPNPTGSGDWAQPTCNKLTPTNLTTDRRTISAVMTNCMGQNGKFQATVIVDVDLFLTAPVSQSTQTIYGEIVGKTSAAIGATLGQPVKRFFVKLYE